MRLVGLISDTHGLLRPQAVAALRGCDPIIHAGDVGDPAVLASLREIAPVFAVRGNVDTAKWAASLPETRTVQVDDRLIYVLHDVNDLDVDLGASGIHAVIAGHSHRPRIESRNGVLHVNPGSAGPRRFALPVTVARLTLSRGELSADIVDIADERSWPQPREDPSTSFWDPKTVHALRRELFAEHLGQDTSHLDDGAALCLYREIARENRSRRDAGDDDWRGLAFSLDPATYGE
jgi:putative phosphoesterase